MLNKALFAAIATGVLAIGVSAQAADGCGRGFHRGIHGVCRPNVARGPAVVIAPSVGVFYPGRGWWDGHRYWEHREAYRHGWRYR